MLCYTGTTFVIGQVYKYHLISSINFNESFFWSLFLYIDKLHFDILYYFAFLKSWI